MEKSQLTAAVLNPLILSSLNLPLTSLSIIQPRIARVVDEDDLKWVTNKKTLLLFKQFHEMFRSATQGVGNHVILQGCKMML